MIDFLGYLVAAAPFLAAAIALVWLRWSAVRAGGLAFSVALAGALFWPALDPAGLPGALLAGFGTSGRVLYVLFGGLLLFNLLSEGGAIRRVSDFLGRLEPEKEALALVVVIGAAPFFESVTGFGVAVVISAPILLAAGFPPLRAAVLASWGQCAVPWGALGVGTVIGADLAGMSFGALSNASALLSLPLFPVYGIAAVALAGGWAGIRRRGLEALFLGSVAGLGTLLTSVYLVPELSGAAGGLCATAVFLALRWRRVVDLDAPLRYLAPYGFLLVLLALANGLEPVQNTLESLGPVFSGPGLPLIISGVFATVLLRLHLDSIASSVRRTSAQWLPTAGAVLTFVLAGEVVASSGAAVVLASAAVAFGNFYPVAGSAIGFLGGAFTGSNAASNALFMPLQVEAARKLGASEQLVAAIQNVAGSHASMLAPQRAILAASATGFIGREGEIVRKLLPPVVVSVAVLALIGVL
ncbi:MAG: L-lactate permease [Rubrobacteraceae bacterium]